MNTFNNSSSYQRQRISPGIGFSSTYRPYSATRIINKPITRRQNKSGIFAKINNFLNNLSPFQFGLLLIVIVLASIWGYSNLSIERSNGEVLGNNESNNSSCRDLLNPSCWSDTFFPKLKQTDGYTNALLIGLDTRDDEQGLMNTDTILVASYDHSTGKTLLISFPRDLYLPYYFESDGPYHTRINSIYAIGEVSGKDGMEILKSNIEDWLGLEIHYTGKVYFDTVISLIDSVDGIEIELAKSYTDEYPKIELPQNMQDTCTVSKHDSNYCLFTFEKGVNKMDGQMALIYARMRKLSSDFDRARRQQEVIDALKNKALAKDGNILDKAKFGWGIYNSLKDEDKVESNVEFSDLMAGGFLLDKADLNPIKIVLSPDFGGGKYLVETSIPLPGSESTNTTTTETTAEVTPTENSEGTVDEESPTETPAQPAVPTMYVIKLVGDSFDGIRNEINRIRKFADNYSEKASIAFVNATNASIGSDDPMSKLRAEKPFFDMVWDVKDKERIEDYRYNIFVFDQNSIKTAEYIATKLGSDSKVIKVYEGTPETQTSHKEDIKVVVANKFIEN